MELNLSDEQISYKAPVLRRRFTKEETIEIIVPDAQPDVLRIVSTECMPYLRTKDAEMGKVTVTGVCDISVLYVPETSMGVQKLGANLQYTASADEAEITQDSLLTANVSVIFSDARMLNSRKLLVRVELMYEIAGYNSQALRVTTGLQEVNNAELLIKEQELVLPAAVNEKTFVMTDMPKMMRDSPEINEILSSNVRFSVEDIRAVGSKAVVKGSAKTQILYRTGETGELAFATFVSPFSQIVELDIESDAATYDIDIMTTGLYVSRDYLEDSSGEAISIEIHAVIQCVAYSAVNVHYISDAYSTMYDLELGYGQIELNSLDGNNNIAVNAVGALDTVQGVKSITGICANAGLPIISRQEETLNITVPITATVHYTNNNNEICCASRKIEAGTQEKMENGCTYEVCVSNIGDAFTNITERGIEVRIPLELDVRTVKEVNENYVNKITCDDNIKDLSARPSLIAYRMTNGDTLWQLCKKYNSLKEEILKANNIESEDEISSGSLLLIPKVK